MVMASPPLLQNEWRPIAQAIREYLRHTYAHKKFGLATDAVPLRLSTFTGKGVGRYATGADGRADWSDEFYGYLSRSEKRTPRDRALRFGYRELAYAMDVLEARFPTWFTVVNALDVHGVRIEEFCIETGCHITTVKRQRKKATFFLYETLRLNAVHERIEFFTVRVI